MTPLHHLERDGVKITLGHHLTPVHCSNRHPSILPIVYLKGGMPQLQALVLPEVRQFVNTAICLSADMFLELHRISQNLKFTSFIVVVVLAEELAAITAATAPRGSGDVGVAAAIIG